MSNVLNAIKRGYAWVDMQERGHFFAEGNYDILGPPVSDGDDELTYMRTRPWSNGKIGTTGCSSTAEWQGAVAALGNPGYGAFNVQGFGAGVGRVGPYYEQGNWYRGGAVQMLFIDWLYGEQNQVRPTFPKNTSQEDLIRASKSFDLAQRLPPVDWAKAFWTLPEMDIIKAVDGPHGIFADSMPVATGGAMIRRAPNDPAWYRGGQNKDNMRINVRGFWYMSWYDVSVGPNLEMFNIVRRTARGEAANQQWAIIAPVGHCSYTRATEHTVVGERDMGDARYPYQEMMFAFFDKFLKGVSSPVMDTLPKVRYYTMGMNKWQTSDTWPPRGATPMTFYLSSGGKANTLEGDGALTMTPPATDTPDNFTYDPANPVMSYGGNVCCQGNAVAAGALRVVGREGHGLHGQGPRRLSRRPRVQPRRVHPADALPRRLRQAAGLDGGRKGVQGDVAAADDEQLVRRPAPPAHRGLEQQLPAVRPQSQHGREELGRGEGRRGAQRRAPLGAVSVVAHRDGGEAHAAVTLTPDRLRLGGERRRLATAAAALHLRLRQPSRTSRPMRTFRRLALVALVAPVASSVAQTPDPAP